MHPKGLPTFKKQFLETISLGPEVAYHPQTLSELTTQTKKHPYLC